MNRTISRLGLTGLALVAGAVAYAQSPTTGMITGKVTVSGNPTAGAKVILSGPALQGARTVVTEADGSFRFSFVPSGQGYQLVVSKAGSETVSSKNITVEPWGNLARNFKLAAAGATVEVFAAPTAVTVDNTTTVDSRTFSAEALQSIPLNNRDYMAAAYLAPGVVDSGRGQANPNMSGATGFENNYIVDGLNVTDPLLGTNNTRINTLAVESVQIQSGGFEPEYGRATGGVISVVTKTGSNDFHGDLEATFRPQSGIAKANAQVALAFNAAKLSQGDANTGALWVGGPLIKDKLWFSVGFSSDTSTTDRNYSQVYFFDPDLAKNNPRTVPAGTGLTPALPAGYSNNGTSYSLKSKTQALTTKLTFSLNTDNTVEMGYNNIRGTSDTNILGMTFSNLAATTQFHENVDTLSLNWRSAISSSWLLDVRAGTYKRKTFYDEGGQFGQAFVGVSAAATGTAGSLNPDGTATYLPPSFRARAYPGTQLGGFGVGGGNDLTRKQFTAKGTNYVGNHTIKYGVDYDETTYKSFSHYTGDFLVSRTINVDAPTGTFVRYVDTYRFRMGAGGTIFHKSDGSTIDPRMNASNGVLINGAGLNLESKTKNLAYFLQDSWQISPKVMVVAGLRMDSQKLFGGDGLEYLSFKAKDMTAPRIGITFDPSGDGKTKLQASFGRYYETVPMDLNQRAGSVEGFFSAGRTYTGTAAAGGIFGIPTVSSLVDPATGNLRAADPTIGAGAFSSVRVIGGAKSDIDPAIKPQSVEEFGLGAERQIADNWKIGAKWKYRYYKNVIEDFSADFGSTYFIGNPGQRGLGLASNHVVDYDYVGQDVWIPFPKPVRDYREMVLSVDKAKGGDKWAMSASLTFATSYGNFAGLDEPLTGQADPNITAVFDLPTLTVNTYGPLPNTPRYNLNMTGSYDLGFGLTLGARFIYRAGVAISATGPDLGYIIGPNTPDDFGGASPYYSANGELLRTGNYNGQYAILEPRGSRGVTPDVTRTDIHLQWDKTLPILRKAKLSLFLDVFNLFNQQMVLTVNQSKAFASQVDGAQSDATGRLITPDPHFPTTTLGFVSTPNPNFLRATSFQAPRSYLAGVRFSF